MRARCATMVFTLSALIFLGAAAPSAAANEPQVMTVVEWLNHEARMANLIVIGEVTANAYPQTTTGHVEVGLRTGEVYFGPEVGERVWVSLKPGLADGRFMPQAPLLKDQWVLFFLRKEGKRWVAPPSGRVVETPYKGLTFYPGDGIVLDDAAPGMSWSYVLDSLKQLIATRRQVINGYLPRLRAAASKEQRDRLNYAIEIQVKEQLGLSVP